MKASEMIRKALENHYSNKEHRRLGKCEFMCHALDAVGKSEGISALEVENVKRAFMPTIESVGYQTLMLYLLKTDSQYAGYYRRWGHHTPSCFKIRVAFWENYIKELESEGL